MQLIIAVFSMIAAVTFYTIGVFSERRAHSLTKFHVIIFWIGLVFDTTGTTIMSRMSDGFTLDIHGITGLIALVLMALHVLWATFVSLKGSEIQKQGFHKFSLFVWLFWLIPFILGIALNM